MSRIDTHSAPPQDVLDDNKLREPEGERIRAELTDFLTRNKIVSIMLDTENHCVDIHSAKLPSRITPILTYWGSIYGEAMDCPTCKKGMGYNSHGKCENCGAYCGCSWDPTSNSDYCDFHNPKVEQVIKQLDRGAK